MAPQNRVTNRHVDPQQQIVGRNGGDEDGASAGDLFLDPMMGTPQAIYVEKDVEDREIIIELITKYGGTVSPGYSGAPYILVDPYKESGQSLYRQYAGKRGKIVLHARWVHECIRAGELQTFHMNWAGCKVIGNERAGPINTQSIEVVPNARLQAAPRQARAPTGQHITQQLQVQQHVQPPPQAPQIPPMPPQMPPGPAAFHYPVYANAPHPAAPRPTMQPPTAAPPQTWQTANGLAAQQAHLGHMQHPQMMTRPQGIYDRDPTQWTDQFSAMAIHHNAGVNGMTAEPQAAAGYYDPRFRDEQQGWASNTQEYYEQPTYEQTYQQHPDNYLSQAGPSQQEMDTNVAPATGPERTRGRKRTRTQVNPAPNTSALVLNRRQPLARSPTPPTRVIKSTYGGNLFTADDVVYLKKYIDFCQEQGLVLSLREICERIAVKAPHHTFYSWRRYCNKHQIRLGGYAMDVEGSRSPSVHHEEHEEDQTLDAGPGPGTVAAAQRMLQEAGPRNRSPTPPRALYRSTTGKGVAFTDDDVSFLVKFLAYRRAQGRLDMVMFWKDVAAKAPHHSRASWMKYYRRHKHELNRVEGDEPLPPAPSKKMRYGKNDDVLLAKYFANKPEGTSDKIFQAFARIYPHHPWKGWQEHHRIHKAKIDYLIQKIHSGEQIDVSVGGEEED